MSVRRIRPAARAAAVVSVALTPLVVMVAVGERPDPMCAAEPSAVRVVETQAAAPQAILAPPRAAVTATAMEAAALRPRPRGATTLSATEAAVFSRDLERARAAFAQAGEEDRWLAALRLSDMAIAAVLACAGRGEPPSAASRDPEFVTTEPSVRHRARVYGFDVGEFPENDALRARVCEAGVARGDPLPAELEAAIAGRVEEAFAALAPGVRHSP